MFKFIILFLLVGLFIYKFVWEYKNPSQIIKEKERMRNVKLSPTKVKTMAIIKIVLLTSVVLVALFLYLRYGEYGIFSTPSKPISEKQMNDLYYYKENGKWNYEGGDAGQNDGVAGDKKTH